jgi:hypothetical protein
MIHDSSPNSSEPEHDLGWEQPHGEKLVEALAQAWPRLDNILSEVVAFQGFRTFLKNYRGNAFTKVAMPPHAQTVVGEALVSFFASLFESTGFSKVAAVLSEQDVQMVLSLLEQQVNLGLYYWCGLDDRNFQFRTVVHFCQLDGVGGPLFATPHKEWYVSFSEDGVRFGCEGDGHHPQTAPAFLAYGLNEFQKNAVRENPAAFQKKLFARLRTLQREICLLEEEWEHRNAIVAVEHGHVHAELRKNRCEETERAAAAVVERIDAFRDIVAEWMLKTFVGVENWISEIAPIFKDDANISAEIDALDAVITSGIQKIFLPASVSRHQYCASIPPLFLAWAEIRCARTPECLACALLRDVTRCAVGSHNFLPSAPDFLEKKNFEWMLTFDPTSALKAFSALVSPAEHKLFTAVSTIAIAQKLAPSRLNTFWVMTLASLANMPGSFPSLKAPPPARALSHTIPLDSIVKRARLFVEESGVDAEGEESRDYLLKFFAPEWEVPQ